MFTEAWCIVEGTVQGVGYRAFVEAKAAEYQIVGYVRNRADGTVEVLAQGTPDDMRDFIEELHEGSVLARVDSVRTEWRSPEKLFTEFQVQF